MVTTGRGIPPWHMWGNTQVISGSDSLGVNTPGIESQLVRIAYKRPETWHWVFCAKLLEADSAGAGEFHSVQVAFNLTVGIGRASIIIPSFEIFTWNWGDAATPEDAPLSYIKFSTQSLGRVRVDTSTTGAKPADPWQTNPPATAATPQGGINTRSVSNVIDKIVAQDIQLQSVVTVSTSGTLSARVEVSAQFAPQTHIRPDWFLEQFPGAEFGGA